jgi:hypothetical protein
MRWFFVCGIALDLAGAVLIAWTIYSRTPAETREEATSRLDANLWTIVFREREQAHVKAGMSALGLGFTLQLVGYILGFTRRFDEVLAPLVAVAIFTSALAALRYVAQRVAPLRVGDPKELPNGLWDERHVHHLATLQDVLGFRSLWLSRLARIGATMREETVSPRVNQGRWLFDCPACQLAGKRTAAVVTPGIETAVCLECGSEFPIRFPEHLAEIERQLMLRPDPTTRNWEPSESVDDLEVENREHGVLA